MSLLVLQFLLCCHGDYLYMGPMGNDSMSGLFDLSKVHSIVLLCLCSAALVRNALKSASEPDARFSPVEQALPT